LLDARTGDAGMLHSSSLETALSRIWGRVFVERLLLALARKNTGSSPQGDSRASECYRPRYF